MSCLISIIFALAMSDEINKVNEPEIEYRAVTSQKKITFFNSFDEAEEHGLKEMSGHSYEKRLENLEILRKRTNGHLLLPDGTWPPLKKIITIEKGTFK